MSPRKIFKDSFHSRILGETVKPVLSPEVIEKVQEQKVLPHRAKVEEADGKRKEKNKSPNSPHRKRA